MSDRDAKFRELYGDLRINGQLRYYSDRVKEYQQAHNQVVVVRNVLLLASAFAGIASQAVAGTPRAIWAVVAAVLASLAGAVTAYESLVGFPQLQKLYDDAKINLEEAAIDWDEPVDTAKQLERVEGIFSSERGQWGQLIVRSAIPGPSVEAREQHPEPSREAPQPPQPPPSEATTQPQQPPQTPPSEAPTQEQ
jgi:SMODS and SLOG-associating 2TM effector domain 1